jgi:hypothetical protein
MEASAGLDRSQVGHVFANRDACAEQRRVSRSGHVGSVVDVQRVDPDEGHASGDKRRTCTSGQEGVGGEVRVGSPVTREIRADKERLAV